MRGTESGLHPGRPVPLDVLPRVRGTNLSRFQTLLQTALCFPAKIVQPGDVERFPGSAVGLFVSRSMSPSNPATRMGKPGGGAIDAHAEVDVGAHRVAVGSVGAVRQNHDARPGPRRVLFLKRGQYTDFPFSN